jgi:5'-nucleotidase / UDP-sugar diphosphatase
MRLLREILLLPATVAAAVALVLTVIVMTMPRQEPPVLPESRDLAPAADAATPPDTVDTTPVLPRRQEVPSAPSTMQQKARTLATRPAPSPDQSRSQAPTEPASRPEASDQGGGTYVVKGGDTPATIARKHLGDAARWPEIARANPGLEARSLQIGQILRLPEGAAPATEEVDAVPSAKQPTAAPAAPLAIHRIAQGDSLYELARRYYGDASRWELIRDANPAIQSGGARELRLDSELIIPALPAANR